MDHTKKVFTAVKSLFDEKRVLVICASDSCSERFYRECVDLLMLSGTTGEMTIRSRSGYKMISKDVGRIYVTTARMCPGMSADVAIVDEVECVPAHIDAARQCTIQRDGEVIV